MENWTGIVEALEREAAELQTAAGVIRRRFLGSVVFSIAEDAPAAVPSPKGRLASASARLKQKRPKRLPGSRVNRDEDRVAQIVALLRRHGAMATKAIAEALSARKSVIKQALQRMQKAGDLTRIGSGPRNWQWSLPATAREKVAAASTTVPAPSRSLADVVSAPAPAPAYVDTHGGRLFAARDAAVLAKLASGPADLVPLIGAMPAETLALSSTLATEHTVTRLLYQRRAIVKRDDGRYELARA